MLILCGLQIIAIEAVARITRQSVAIRHTVPELLLNFNDLRVCEAPPVPRPDEIVLGCTIQLYSQEPDTRGVRNDTSGARLIFIRQTLIFLIV